MAIHRARQSRHIAMAALGLGLMVALSGCAKKHLYPGDRRPDDQVAYIQAERYLLAGVEFSVDGVPAGSLAQYYVPPGVGDSWFLGRPTIGASVLPGRHEISAHVASYGWVSAARTVCAAMTFQADGGQRYALIIDKGVLALRNLGTGLVIAQTALTDCVRQARVQRRMPASVLSERSQFSRKRKTIDLKSRQD